MRISFEQYEESEIINRSLIPVENFNPYSAQAERLINQAVTKPQLLDNFEECVVDVAAILCHQLWIDNNSVSPVLDDENDLNNGAKLKSISESSGTYSYSLNFVELANESQKNMVYNKIITDGLMYCDGIFTGLFFAGAGGCR